jgi:hypothetical protein
MIASSLTRTGLILLLFEHISPPSGLNQGFIGGQAARVTYGTEIVSPIQ